MKNHRCLTPPECVPSWEPVPQQNGESGSFAEEQIWGGIVTREEVPSDREFRFAVSTISSFKNLFSMANF
jgi:hypothetical protein